MSVRLLKWLLVALIVAAIVLALNHALLPEASARDPASLAGLPGFTRTH